MNWEELRCRYSALYWFITLQDLIVCKKGIHVRAIQRLFIFGLLAAPFFIALKSWLPLNIIFALLFSTYLIYLIERDKRDGRIICVFTFIIGGFFVEYTWLTLAYCLAAWWFCKSPNIARGLLWIAITALLWVVNLNYWALAALPIIFLASYINIKIPRLRFVFYGYYPAHLALLLIIQKLMPISI